MKKVLSLVLVIGAVFCLAGCGVKKAVLTCTKKQSNADMTITANFTGNKLTAMNVSYGADYSSYSDTAVKTLENRDFCSLLKSTLSQYTITECKQSLENKILSVKMGIDVSKERVFESPESAKTTMEKQGLTCTLR